jgi:hypothetical protein
MAVLMELMSSWIFSRVPSIVTKRKVFRGLPSVNDCTRSAKLSNSKYRARDVLPAWNSTSEIRHGGKKRREEEEDKPRVDSRKVIDT